MGRLGRLLRPSLGAGLVIGAVAGFTAAAIGSAYYSLPYGCSPYHWGGYGYYSCGGAYYQPQYEGDTVVYVQIEDPSHGQQAPTVVDPNTPPPPLPENFPPPPPKGDAPSGH